MNSEDLKLFAIFYIKEDEVLSNKEKIQLMEFVEQAQDEEVLFLLATGQMPGERIVEVKNHGDAFRIEESYEAAKGIAKAGFYVGKAGFQGMKTYKTFKGDSKHESPVGQSTMFLGGTAAASFAAAVSYKLKKKHLVKMGLQCDKEKGKAKKVCYNKIRRDAIRVEIVSLSSMKVKCRKTKDSEKCIKKIEQRIKELQNRMDSIKVF